MKTYPSCPPKTYPTETDSQDQTEQVMSGLHSSRCEEKEYKVVAWWVQINGALLRTRTLQTKTFGAQSDGFLQAPLLHMSTSEHQHLVAKCGHNELMSGEREQ